MGGTGHEVTTLDVVTADKTSPDDVSAPVVVLTVTLAVAVVAQGAFDGPSRWVVTGGIAVLAILGLLRHRRVEVTPVAIATSALAAWILWRGVTADALVSALWQVGLLCAVGVTATTARRANESERDALLGAVTVIGVGVALSGWLGAAFRIEPWGNPGPSTWRASSTLTYPNAAAAVMTMAIMVVLARVYARPDRRLDVVAATVLIAGVIATQSRGGALALLVGLAVFTTFAGLSVTAKVLLAPVTGAVVAAVIALPALDATAETNPSRMIVALLLGILVAVAITELTARATQLRRWGLLVVPVIAALGVAQRDRFPDVARDRLQLGSADRVNTTREALSVLEANLFTGVGPGNVNLIWRFDDRLVTTRFVHNEYLQVAAEGGLVSVALLGLAILAGAAALWSARNAVTASPTWIAGVAALSALGFHSAFDFLWHIPAIPLLAAAIFGCAVASDGSAGTAPPTTVDAHSGVDLPKGSSS